MSIFPQAPNAVVMIRPHHFCPNEETKQDNSFQSTEPVDKQQVKSLAFEQVTTAGKVLEAEGVLVHTFEDHGKETPDSVFPNNWFYPHRRSNCYIPYVCQKSQKRA